MYHPPVSIGGVASTQMARGTHGRGDPKEATTIAVSLTQLVLFLSSYKTICTKNAHELCSNKPLLSFTLFQTKIAQNFPSPVMCAVSQCGLSILIKAQNHEFL